MTVPSPRQRFKVEYATESSGRKGCWLSPGLQHHGFRTRSVTSRNYHLYKGSLSSADSIPAPIPTTELSVCERPRDPGAALYRVRDRPIHAFARTLCTREPVAFMPVLNHPTAYSSIRRLLQYDSVSKFIYIVCRRHRLLLNDPKVALSTQGACVACKPRV